jgi:hypothetical protein
MWPATACSCIRSYLPRLHGSSAAALHYTTYAVVNPARSFCPVGGDIRFQTSDHINPVNYMHYTIMKSQKNVAFRWME